MKRFKVVLSIIIIAVVVFASAFQIFPALSMDSEDVILLSVQKKYALPGEEVAVNVMLENNPGIASLKFQILYDEILELKDVTFNKGFGNYISAPEPYSSPQTISFISPFKNINTEGCLAVLTFKVAENAKENYCAKICLLSSKDDVFDKDFNVIQISSKNGMIIIGDETDHKHIDDNDDAICDDCGMTIDNVNACKCMCHKDGIFRFFWKIVRIVYKVLDIHNLCDCGEIHY